MDSKTKNTFKMRTKKPNAGNKYYITKDCGGWNPAIKGSPTDKDCNVLSNCVGYAIGRFNEIGGYKSCKYLRSTNAENFIEYKNSELKVGIVPKVGACMVWKKGNTLSSFDGAGHVAIVEKVIDNNKIITSESGYNSKKPFWTQTRTNSDGNWSQNSSYKFLGFIYNPATIIVEDNNVESSTSVSNKNSIAPAKCFSNSISGKYKTKDALNIRNNAGTTNTRVLSVIPKGGTVRCYGYYTVNNNIKWLYIVFSTKNKKIYGYVSSKYLVKI